MVITVLLISCINSYYVKADKLHVSIYYETLCYDSVKFIRKQLQPAFETLKEHLVINFIPYGKAFHKNEENGKISFQCHHGPNECFSNKIHACVLNTSLSTEEIIKFVSCSIGSYQEKNLRLCAEEVNLSYDLLKMCANNIAGSNFLAKYGDITLNVDPVITFVPTIIFNNSYSSENQNDSLNDFLFTACSLIEDKPEKCPAKISKRNSFWWF